MATSDEWASAYARQADADFTTFETLQSLPLPQCHKLQFLQMACEKLVKAHLCGIGTDPESCNKVMLTSRGRCLWSSGSKRYS